MNLLIFKVSALAENVVFTPVVQQLRRTFPNGRITLFTTAEAAGLYSGPLAASRVFTSSREFFNASWKTPIAFFRFWWEAHSARAAASLIDADQGSAAHMLSFLTVEKMRVGSAETKLRIPSSLTHVVQFPSGSAIADWSWEMGRALAANLGRYDWPLRCPPPDLTHLIQPKTQSGGRPCVVIDSSAILAYRSWPEERFRELARRLAGDFEIVWISSPGPDAGAASKHEKTVAGRNLGEVVSALASARLLVSNHNATAQLASALGTPSVIVAGPTDPEWDPCWYPDRINILRMPGLNCLPCEGHRSVPGRCLHQGSPLACMQYWSAAEVEQHSRDWIERWKSAPQPNPHYSRAPWKA